MHLLELYVANARLSQTGKFILTLKTGSFGPGFFTFPFRKETISNRMFCKLPNKNSDTLV
jgi:hypothetical protein